MKSSFPSDLSFFPCFYIGVASDLIRLFLQFQSVKYDGYFFLQVCQKVKIMFSRRNLRRNFVITVCLPIILLVAFIIHKNRDIVFPEHQFNHQYKHKYVSRFSRNTNKISYSRSGHSTNRSRSAILLANEQPKSDNSMIINSYTIPFVSALNRDSQLKEFHSIQQASNPVIDTKNLARFVHLDLKGAALKIDYYEQLFPFLKKLGATGLLIEYEDMFPFADHLAVIQHGLAYTKNDIQQILHLAEANKLEVVPLLQVYGHLEYVLKLKEFMHLREDRRYPQVITPCLEESYKLIFGMLIQCNLSESENIAIY